MNQLPLWFTNELIRRVNETYPSTKDILLNAPIIIEQFKNQSNVKNQKAKFNERSERSSSTTTSNGKNILNKSKFTNFSPSNYQANSQFTNNSTPTLKCRFCTLNNHSTTSCNKYQTYPLRVERAKQLKLCSLCLSSRHNAISCPNKIDLLCKICTMKRTYRSILQN